MKRGDFVQEECCCVMIVSTNNKVIDFIKTFLPQNKFYPVIVSANAAEARRTLRRTPIDIVIIDTPLPDEFGTKLAEDMSKECAVAVIVKPELVERTVYKLEPHGVITLSKMLQRSIFQQTLLILASSVSKMKKLWRDNSELKLKLRDLKLITYAKSSLITEKGMTEDEAHRYIEKTAMDKGMKKSDAVKIIIDELSNK